MAKWLYHLEIAQEFHDCQEGKITIQQLASTVVSKTKQLKCYNTFEYLQNIVDRINDLANDTLLNDVDAREAFDELWEELYDWGDTTVRHGWPPTKLCWINTILSPQQRKELSDSYEV